MSTISLRIPNSLHDAVCSIPKQEHTSINHLTTLALAEKVSALMTEDYLSKRAAPGSRKKFERAMANVPSVPPVPGDEI